MLGIKGRKPEMPRINPTKVAFAVSKYIQCEIQKIGSLLQKSFNVIPAKPAPEVSSTGAGIQVFQDLPDPGCHRGGGFVEFCKRLSVSPHSSLFTMACRDIIFRSIKAIMSNSHIFTCRDMLSHLRTILGREPDFQRLALQSK
jgi:hypothetical protein